MIPDYQYWEEQATKLRRTGLERLRGQAEKWQAALTALLGVFGAVALFEAPTKLAELAWPMALALVVVSLVATGLVLRAIKNASDVAIGVPEGFVAMGGPGLEEWTYQEAATALNKLKTSRTQGISAVSILLAGFAIVWLMGVPWDPKPAAVRILAIQSGNVVCGELTAKGDELRLKLRSGKVLQMTDLSGIVSTEGCPK